MRLAYHYILRGRAGKTPYSCHTHDFYPSIRTRPDILSAFTIDSREREIESIEAIEATRHLMNRTLGAISLMALLAACGDGQPFFMDSTTNDQEGTTADRNGDAASDAAGGDASDENGTETDVLSTGTVRPPITSEPDNVGYTLRLEADGGEGGGLVSEVIYVAENDTFIVDGLAFDGANTYSRGEPVGQINGYAVFEADVVTPDFLTDEPIGQIVPHRALYGVSDNDAPNGDPRTSFAVVRTGGYVEYGFGGFLYERNGDVVLPTTGQAIYSGDYAGIRVFADTSGLEYTTGDMFIQIDFRDFNSTDGIYGEVNNRQAFNIDGTPVTFENGDQFPLPTIQFVIEEGDGDISSNGEFSGAAFSTQVVDGQVEDYETGSYYAVLAGDTTSGDGGEIVGVLVVESDDPRFENVTVQETGGFILYRGDDN